MRELQAAHLVRLAGPQASDEAVRGRAVRQACASREACHRREAGVLLRLAGSIPAHAHRVERQLRELNRA